MTRYEPAIDLDAITAIDVHVHIEVDGHGNASLPPDLAEAASPTSAPTALVPTSTPSPSTTVSADGGGRVHRRRADAARHPALSSAEIAEGAARNNDVLIPFGSVDPNRGTDAVDLARRLIDDHGVRGFKFHPTVQGFDPSDEAHHPLYEVLEDAGVVALFHTGQTGIGAGLPGGRGLLLGLSNPILLDPVAAHFPDLQIVMAHPSVPWQDEALSVATHKHNTWIDLSGWSPKYFPAELVRYANSILKRRVLFGSDFPLLTPERWMSDVEQTALKPEVMPGILKDNAARLLGIGR